MRHILDRLQWLCIGEKDNDTVGIAGPHICTAALCNLDLDLSVRYRDVWCGNWRILKHLKSVQKIKPAALINPPHVTSHALSPSQNEIADPRAQFNYLLHSLLAS